MTAKAKIKWGFLIMAGVVLLVGSIAMMRPSQVAQSFAGRSSVSQTAAISIGSHVKISTSAGGLEGIVTLIEPVAPIPYYYIRVDANSPLYPGQIASGYHAVLTPAPAVTAPATPSPAPPATPAPGMPGLVADGVTDNCVAMTAAIRQQQPIRWPSGVIAFSCPMDFNVQTDAGFRVKDIIWTGNGPSSTILKYTGPGAAIVAGRSAPFYGPGFRLSDLAIFCNGTAGQLTPRVIGGYTTSGADNSGTNSTQTGLVLNTITVPGPILDNVTIKFCDTGLITGNVYNMALLNSVIQTNNVGVRLSDTSTAIRISNTQFSGNAVGLWLQGTGMQSIHIRENTFEANHAGTAILSNGGEFIHVEGNYFTANVDNVVHIGYNPATMPGAGILAALYVHHNFGVSVKLGDSVRLAYIENNGADDTAAYSIKNQYTFNDTNARQIHVSRNWSPFGPKGYGPYTKYDGTQAVEFIHD